MTKTDDIASKLLGKRIEGLSEYNPSILVAVPRSENRKIYGINYNNLPFCGYDIWHCYEFSVLTQNSIPVTRVLKLKYSCNSDFIIESKSLKLYLNSFNMMRFGKNEQECLDYCKHVISTDLSNKLETNVDINFINPNDKRIEIFSEFKNIMDFVNQEKIKINEFKESSKLLKIIETSDYKEHYIKFDSLRSNCRVTHQPDFGDVFIYYKSKKIIDYESLVKYLVSFRCEYHFHEECCEMIYKRLFDILDTGDKLMVCAIYTRRGGIDITPIRYSYGINIEDIDILTDIGKFARYGIKQ